LDGIPLAIELAAARVKALTPEMIGERLDDRFRLLTGGNRTALPRQQTLRATVDWSYDLLTEAERVLLQWLSVFAGGWTLEAAEAVCAGEGIESTDVLDLLTRLVDKSIAVMSEVDGIPRYRLLETIQQYAHEILQQTNAEGRIRDRHLDYFQQLSQSVEKQLNGPPTVDQVSLVKRLLVEIHNIRGALDWAGTSGRIDDGLVMLDGFYYVFIISARHTELLHWLQLLLAQPVQNENTCARAQAYNELDELYTRMGEFDLALAALEKSRAICVALADADMESVVVMRMVSKIWWRGEYDLARTYVQKWRELVTAGNLLDEVSIREIESGMLGFLALSEGDYVQAARWFTIDLQAIAKSGGSGNKIATSSRARALGYALLYQGDTAQAATYLRESLVDNASLNDTQAVAACLSAFAALAMACEEFERAARLFGVSEAITDSIHTPLQYWDVEQVRRNVNALRGQLDETTLKAAWAEGHAMTYQQAIDYALAE
jgi:non-specific serine/threonine protein kinase